MDIKTYLERKETGFVTLVATGTIEEPTYTIVKKNFDPDTREQVEDTFTEMSLKELLEQKAALTKQLKDLNAFIEESKILAKSFAKDLAAGIPVKLS